MVRVNKFVGGGIYADDFLLGFAGTKGEAEQIKSQLATFLREELRLEMSPAKTLITHARTGVALFLGYEVNAMWNNLRIHNGWRGLSGHVGLRKIEIPIRVPNMRLKAVDGRELLWQICDVINRK